MSLCVAEERKGEFTDGALVQLHARVLFAHVLVKSANLGEEALADGAGERLVRQTVFAQLRARVERARAVLLPAAVRDAHAHGVTVVSLQPAGVLVRAVTLGASESLRMLFLKMILVLTESLQRRTAVTTRVLFDLPVTSVVFEGHVCFQVVMEEELAVAQLAPVSTLHHVRPPMRAHIKQRRKRDVTLIAFIICSASSPSDVILSNHLNNFMRILRKGHMRFVNMSQKVVPILDYDAALRALVGSVFWTFVRRRRRYFDGGSFTFVNTQCAVALVNS